MISPSECKEEYIDKIILDYYNEWCILPEWTKDVRYDYLILPPKIMWYISNGPTFVNDNNELGGVMVRSYSDRYTTNNPNHSKVYAKYFYDTLTECVFRLGFFRVGLINIAARKSNSNIEEVIQGVVRHEWRHLLQQLYLLKMNVSTHGNKSLSIHRSYGYNAIEQIFEEDAREVQFCNPNKPIEEFYLEYKRNEYIYLRRNIRNRNKTTKEIILID